MNPRQIPARARTYCYRVTSSAVDTVPVGTFLIDHEDAPANQWTDHRTWHAWDSESGNFYDAWSAVRIERLCSDCRRLGSAALHGHDGEHGAAEAYKPPTPVEVTR